MKFKEQRDNVFVFEGGYEREEFELKSLNKSEFYWRPDCDVYIDKDLIIDLDDGCASYQDIQTAVCMMQILIKEGLV